MKQFQVIYANPADFRLKMTGVKSACENMSHRSILIYITWTDGAREVVDYVTNTIDDLFPDALYYGNEASGSISSGEITFGISVTCYVFEKRDTKTELLWVEEGTEYSSLEDLWEYCRGRKGLRGVELIPSMSYVETLKIDNNEPLLGEDVTVFGGASVNYDNATYDADILAKGHARTQKGMAVILYYGKKLAFSTSSVLGWKGLGHRMDVTDSTGKCIRRIDGFAAYSIYEKYLNLSVEDKDTLVFPLIMEEDGVEFIRTPQNVMSDKSMQMFATVPTGAKVRIAYGDKNTILDEIYSSAKEIASFRPDGIRAYSCAARRLFWGNGEISKETQILQKIAPVCGFYTGGEILKFGKKLRVLNQTLALVSVREGEGEERDVPVRKIEDKSLITRLTYFTETIVEEEKAQRKLAEGLEKVLASEYQVMYYIDLVKGKSTFLAGDEEALKFVPIFNAETAEELFENFRFYYVNKVVDKADRERVAAVMNAENVLRVLKTSNSVSVNYRVRRNWVDSVYTEMRIFKAEEENGEITAAVLAFKQTDEELRTALEIQEKLKEDAQIISGLANGYVSLFYANLDEGTFRMYALDEERLPLTSKLLRDGENSLTLIQKIGQSESVHPDDRHLFAELDTETVRGYLVHTKKHTIRYRGLFEGEYRWAEMDIIKYEPVDERPNVIAIGFAERDAEIRGEMEQQQQLAEARDAAEEANRSKTNFLFSMSHDIRTPMNAIIGFTGMAQKHIDDKDKVADCLNKAQQSGNLLLSLINGVLDVSRIESGNAVLEESPADVYYSFAAIEDTMKELAAAKDISLSFALENIQDQYVFCDINRCNRIFVNILSNAIKYTPAGGNVSVLGEQIKSDRPGYGVYRYTFTDNGIGMSEEFQKHVFDQFSRERTTTMSGIQGTGLGMAVSKSFTDLMGGTIECRSKLGQGTTFTVTLPFRIQHGKHYVDPFTREETEASAPPLAVAHIDFAGRKVLLVEDNELNREIAEEILKEEDLIVETATDGSVAVDILRKKGPDYYDFILMDIQMPIMNGYEATQEIRSMYPGVKLPIIAVSANAFEEDRQMSIAAGMNDHVAKPIDVDALRAALAKFL